MVVVNGHDGPQSNAREIIDRSKKKRLEIHQTENK